jgi:cell wall-associated NlpC family hydrolase
MGLGLTMNPAAAAPDNDIDAAQARADRLAAKADKVEQRHEKVAASLDDARAKKRAATAELHRQQRLLSSLRAQVASTVVDEYSDEEYDGSAGTATPDGPLDAKLVKTSEVMLTNATVVSEDTGARGDAMARSNMRIERLTHRRAMLRTQITKLAGVEQTLGVKAEKAGAREADASAVLAELEEKRIAEMGGPAVAYAKAQVGKSYVYGAAGPDAFDCSGLTMAAWSEAGVSLPHSSSAQYSAGQQISESELQPGDLVFYYSPISHVGMYIGDGQIVNALNPGSGVQISGLHDMPYSGAVRVG